MARQQISYESRVELVKQKIKEKPENALKEIGKFLTKEIRANTPRGIKRKIKLKSGSTIEIKPGRLRKSVGYWYRKKEGDLQIGLKAFYAAMIELGTSTHRAHPFFMKTVEANIGVIQSMIEEALRELNKE
ncbi:HK97-gp10 family putative phage morphogenesis protein [Pseudobacteroides cellulosolvens]|nr:HK97-gp10 family putative phage morphogenesis protein [Pseudobacteroides cellulosolvens]